MTDKKKHVLFTGYSYGIFWLYLLLCFCFVFTGLLKTDGLGAEIVTVPGSWAPTAALLII